MKRPFFNPLFSAVLGGASLLTWSGRTNAQAGPDDGPPPPQHMRHGPATRPAPVEVDGTLKGYNYGPHGNVEGLLVQTGDGKLAQINFPPDAGSVVTGSANVGESLKTTVVPPPPPHPMEMMGMGRMGGPGGGPGGGPMGGMRGMHETPDEPAADHPVYHLVSLTGPSGKTLTIPGPGDEKLTHVEGTVQQLNYGHRGEVNGVVLDTGDVVLLGPDAAQKLNLNVGQKVTVDGMGVPKLSGHSVVNAYTINGVTIRTLEDKGGPGGGPEGDHGPRGMRGGRDGEDGGPKGMRGGHDGEEGDGGPHHQHHDGDQHDGPPDGKGGPDGGPKGDGPPPMP